MEPKLEVTMDEYLPLRDVVFKTLRQAILRGELKPGERLMEIKLANKLGGEPHTDPGGDPQAGAGRSRADDPKTRGRSRRDHGEKSE